MMTSYPPLVILEGADGVGKSTLGRHLAKQFDAFYFHATATKSLVIAMRDYQQNLLDNVRANIALGRGVVMDRFWPSELIYGSIFRPDNPYGFCYKELAEACAQLGAIYVCAFSATAVERHKIVKDSAHPYDDSAFARVYASYEDFWEANKHDPAYLRYDLENYGSQMHNFGQLIACRYNELICKRSLAQ